MTLKEAIKTTQDLDRRLFGACSIDETDALKLLIEAGKLTEGLRAGLPRDVIRLLPGETKE